MKKLMVSFVAISVLLFSCEKGKISTNKETSLQSSDEESTKNGDFIIGDYEENMKNCVDNDVVSYYLDGRLVSPGTYDPTNENLFGIVEGDSIENYIHFNMFTNIEDYFQYGRDNGYGNTLEGEFNFQRIMRQYIESNNIEQYYETYGDVPQSYLDYERMIYEREILDNQDRTGLTILYKNETGGGSTPMLTPFKPFFWDPTYNNEISRYTQYNAGFGWLTIYHKKFYNTKVGPTLGRVGWNWVVFNDFHGLKLYNDKMSSGISL